MVEGNASARLSEPELIAQLERAVVLTPGRHASQAGFSRWLNEMSEPEVFQWGNISVSSSLTTAIKRRNPLCLLDPTILNVLW